MGFLSDDDLRQLMVDWRAPEAGTFYQATAFERMGVRRRRHLILSRRDVVAIVGGFATALSLARDSDLVASVPERHTGKLRAGMHSLLRLKSMMR